MALRLPTSEYLHQLVVDNYFELNQQELDALQELIPGLFHSYELLAHVLSPGGVAIQGPGAWSPS